MYVMEGDYVTLYCAASHSIPDLIIMARRCVCDCGSLLQCVLTSVMFFLSEPNDKRIG